MMMSEFNQSNHAMNCQCDFGQPVFHGGYSSWVQTVNINRLVETDRKTKTSSIPYIVKKMHFIRKSSNLTSVSSTADTKILHGSTFKDICFILYKEYFYHNNDLLQ